MNKNIAIRLTQTMIYTVNGLVLEVDTIEFTICIIQQMVAAQEHVKLNRNNTFN